MRETDQSVLLRMVAEHEGKNQRIWRLTGWRGTGVLVFVIQQQPTGFVLMVAPTKPVLRLERRSRCDRNLGLFAKPRTTQE